MIELPYNRQAAVSYARRWAFDRNPDFYSFDNIGGDCTNFVSQCIYAGAGVMNFTPVYGWYYLSSYNRTASWTGVEYLYNFLVNNMYVGPYGHQVEENEIEPGDVVQLGDLDGEDGDFYHTILVTETYPEILVASHSNDAFNRPLSSYDFDLIRFIHIEGVRSDEE